MDIIPTLNVSSCCMLHATGIGNGRTADSGLATSSSASSALSSGILHDMLLYIIRKRVVLLTYSFMTLIFVTAENPSHGTSGPKSNGGGEGKKERTGWTAVKGRGEFVLVCFPVGKAQLPMSPYVAPYLIVTSPGVRRHELSSRGPNDLVHPQRGVTYRGRALVLAPDVRRRARPV